VDKVSVSKGILKQMGQRFGIIGESQGTMTAVGRMLQVAPTDLTVLITGETGTGKDVFAHAIHDLSPRKKYPFISVNCGAIPETLLESELFGAEKGAYTGSTEQRKGFFEAANRGTLFLDEIGEMPIGTQVKLLRVLENGEFSRLGSADTQRVDVRVIAATNRDLLYEVRQGRFRQDLYFRLNSINIHLPPLRQHTEDVAPLVDHFARRAAERNNFDYQGIDDAALNTLINMPWQGNIRELRNVVETMVTLEHGARITSELLAPYLPSVEPIIADNSRALVRVMDVQQPAADADLAMLYKTLLQLANDVTEMKTVLRHLLSMTFDQTSQSTVNGQQSAVNSQQSTVNSIEQVDSIDEDLNLMRIEKLAIEMALRRTQGSRREAAKILGISERTLYRKIDDYGLQ